MMQKTPQSSSHQVLRRITSEWGRFHHPSVSRRSSPVPRPVGALLLAACLMMPIRASAANGLILSETCLRPDGITAGDGFGRAVVLQGDLLVVGAPGHDEPDYPDAGAVFVYRRASGIWSLESTLTAPEPRAGSGFGLSISASDDTIAVGAPGVAGSSPGVGAVHVFTRVDGAWMFQSTLASNVENDGFGASVATDKGVLLVGAPQAGSTRGGMVFAYTRADDGWHPIPTLQLNRAVTGDLFGASVQIRDDVAVVGAPGRDEKAEDTGAAYTYQWSGTSWASSDPLRITGAAGDAVGSAVGYGGTLCAVGAPGNGAGQAVVCQKVAGVWTSTPILPAGLPEDAAFGASVAVGEDIAAAGAPAGRDHPGQVAFLIWNGAVWGSPNTLSAGEAGDRFGASVAVGGSTVAAGAPNSVNGGAVYVYEVTPARKLAFSVQPGGAEPGSPFTPQPVVVVQDAHGLTVPRYTGTVSLSLQSGAGPPGAVLNGWPMAPVSNGQATFAGLSIDRPGNGYVLTATSDFLLAAASAPVSIGPLFTYVRPDGDDANDGMSWSSAKRTIRAAENIVAAPGGEVWVMWGQYAGGIVVKNGASLYGGFAGYEVDRGYRDPSLPATILQGGDPAVVTLASGSAFSVLDGFSIQDGTIGVICAGSRTRIINNVISNSANEALRLDNGSQIVVENLIRGNGAGIVCSLGASLIGNNTIHDNGGPGIACDGGSPVITTDVITGNGDGLRFVGGTPVVTGNTIVANERGICFAQNARPSMANTIVAFNGCGIVGEDPASPQPVLRHNCVFGNTSGNFVGTDDPTGVDGNISVNPWLAAPASGNMHILPDSPCRDAGDDTLVFSALDMDEEPRRNGASVDIGADESDGSAAITLSVLVRVSPDGNDANDGFSWLRAKRTIQAAVEVAGIRGGEVWVARGVYQEHVRLHPFVSLFGGFAGTEMSRTQRDWERNATVLDGGGENCVVEVTRGHQFSRIDGFTIQNGSQGIRSDSAGPVIANNIIATNDWGILAESGTPTIVNNLLYGNRYSAVQCSGNVVLANNTIVANAVGFNADFEAAPLLTDNIIAYNTVETHVGAYAQFRGNCLFANGTREYVDRADPLQSDGNTDADPKMRDVAHGDVHLEPGSPTRKAGVNALGTWTADIVLATLNGDVPPASPPDDDTLQVPAVRVIRVRPEGNDAADGATWVSAKRTIQAAMQAARGKDVWVAGGVYTGPIDVPPFTYLYGGFRGTEDTLDQRDPVGVPTTLDGEGKGSVVTIQAGDRFASIDGFTIQNGIADFGGGIHCVMSSGRIANCTVSGNSALYGGGIYCDGAAPVVEATVLRGNTAVWRGGGIYGGQTNATVEQTSIAMNQASYGAGGYWTGGAPVVRNSVIEGNAATMDSGGAGFSDSFPTIQDTLIRENTAPYGGGVRLEEGGGVIRGNLFQANLAQYAGALDLDGSPAGQVTGNTFRANSATGGGAVRSIGAAVEISSNVFLENTAVMEGGAVLCLLPSPTLAFSNNTFVANEAQEGGGVRVAEGAAPTLVNNILALGNSGVENDAAAPGTPMLRHNCFFGQTEYSVRGIPDPIGVDGNILTDPQLTGDGRLQPPSRCIDAGDDSVIAPGAVDRDGQPRIHGSHVDIGAYESVDTYVWTLVATALEVAGGLRPCTQEEASRMDVVPAGAPDGRIDLEDVVRLARHMAGLDTPS